MFVKLKNQYRKIGYTKYKRIQNYIDLLDEKFTVRSIVDKQRIKEIRSLTEETIKAVKILTLINTISYFGIYFSVISAIFSMGPILSTLTETLGLIVGFFGTTLFVALLFFTSKLNDLYYQDLNLMTSHLITIYSKHKMKDESLYGGENSYKSFMRFFSENL